jgi:hypothetical protein
MSRRFPPPWTAIEENGACFIVKDHNGQSLAYVYFEEEPGRRAAAKLLTRDEARRIAANIAAAVAAVKRGVIKPHIHDLPCHVGLCSNCGHIAASR